MAPRRCSGAPTARSTRRNRRGATRSCRRRDTSSMNAPCSRIDAAPGSRLHDGKRRSADHASLSVLVRDAARAFRRDAPVALAELSTHALVANDTREEVAVALRQARMHHVPPIRWRRAGAVLDGMLGGETASRVYGRATGGMTLGLRISMRRCAL